MIKTADDVEDAFKDGKILIFNVLWCSVLSQKHCVSVPGSVFDENKCEDSHAFDGAFFWAWKATEACCPLRMQASKEQEWILQQFTIF